MLKRLFDLAIVSCLAPAALPRGMVLALLVWSERKGSILYRGRRAGYRGEAFGMLKFRTMYPLGARALTSAQREAFARDFKLDEDPRITPLGR